MEAGDGVDDGELMAAPTHRLSRLKTATKCRMRNDTLVSNSAATHYPVPPDPTDWRHRNLGSPNKEEEIPIVQALLLGHKSITPHTTSPPTTISAHLLHFQKW